MREDMPPYRLLNFSRCSRMSAFCSGVFLRMRSETTYEVASLVMMTCEKRSPTRRIDSATKLNLGLSKIFSCTPKMTRMRLFEHISPSARRNSRSYTICRSSRVLR